MTKSMSVVIALVISVTLACTSVPTTEPTPNPPAQAGSVLMQSEAEILEVAKQACPGLTETYMRLSDQGRSHSEIVIIFANQLDRSPKLVDETLEMCATFYELVLEVEKQGNK